MRVAIDARPALDPRRTGVGQYTQQLIRHLPFADLDDEYVAWYLHARGLLRPRRFFADVRARNLTEKASRFPARIFQPASDRLGIPRVEWLIDFDLFVATNFLAPATSHADRVVPVVHDLAFQHFPESAPHIDERWRRRFAATLAGSPAIIVPSTSAADDLRDAFPVADDRVHVVHHGVDAEAFAPAPEVAIDAVRRRYGIPGPYVLFVGGIEPRKNLEHLVRAFAKSDARHLSLVLAGGPVRWFPKATERLDATIELLPEGVRDRIVRTGYVSERDKVALLSGATVLAYPSLYEGFGFPVLEGFAAGVPVLTSNVSSLPEVAGEAAVLVDPTDVDAIADALSEMVADEDLRAVLSAAGVARASRFTWEATARATAAVLRDAAVLTTPGKGAGPGPGQGAGQGAG
ncbi:MAG: glycosyltransferase family 4 protein [Actinomycetota bacterium]